MEGRKRGRREEEVEEVGVLSFAFRVIPFEGAKNSLFYNLFSLDLHLVIDGKSQKIAQ